MSTPSQTLDASLAEPSSVAPAWTLIDYDNPATLPESGKRVLLNHYRPARQLALGEGTLIQIAAWETSGQWCTDSGDEIAAVHGIKWMPLPALPEEP